MNYKLHDHKVEGDTKSQFGMKVNSKIETETYNRGIKNYSKLQREIDISFQTRIETSKPGSVGNITLIKLGVTQLQMDYPVG